MLIVKGLHTERHDRAKPECVCCTHSSRTSSQHAATFKMWIMIWSANTTCTASAACHSLFVGTERMCQYRLELRGHRLVMHWV